MFDEKQHALRLERARRAFVQGDDFLMRLVVEDLTDRLSTVTRTFDHATCLFARTPALAEQISSLSSGMSIQRIEEPSHIGDADLIATPESLNLTENSTDLIIAPLSLHWSNDLPGSLIQIARALRPDGLLLATLPGPDTLIELRQSLLQAESELSGGAALRIDPFTDIRDAGSLLQRAGFALPVVDQETVTVRYNTALDLIRDLRRFGATSHLADKNSPLLTREIVARMVEVYADRFADPDGRIRATFSFISLSGWKPHESQQKPLKPGSAKATLADALGTHEVKLKP